MLRRRTLIRLALAAVAAAVLGFLALLVLVPAWYRATAVPVHADAASVPVRATTPDPAFAEAAAEATSLARALVAEANLPGLSLAVGVGDRLVWQAGVGWADIAGRRPITPDTLFRIGSVSKSLTSAGAGLLVRRGALDLDAPVQRYVPQFPDRGTPITTRQAMAHTAGFRHLRGERDHMPQRHCASTVEGLDLFAGDALEFPPGSAWRFSTYGWILVSAVVEAAAGRPFEAFMAEEVFAPLGMHSTLFDQAHAEMPRRALFYFPRAWEDTRYGLQHPDDVDYACFSGAGRYLSTPGDLVRFGLAMDRHLLLDRATTAALQAPVTLPSGTSTDYGLGWDVRRVPFNGGEALQLGHPGTVVGGTTVLKRYPEQGIVVAVSSNITFAELAPLATQVAERFAAARPRTLAAAER